MVRYADLVCENCGAIHPANEMVHTAEDRGWTTNRIGEAPGRGVYTENWVSVVYCQECAPKVRNAQRSGFLLGMGGALIAMIAAPIALVALAAGMFALNGVLNDKPSPTTASAVSDAVKPGATADQEAKPAEPWSPSHSGPSGSATSSPQGSAR